MRAGGGDVEGRYQITSIMLSLFRACFALELWDVGREVWWGLVKLAAYDEFEDGAKSGCEECGLTLAGIHDL